MNKNRFFKLKESLNWFQTQTFLNKHKKIKLCDINYFKNDRIQTETFWLPEIYDEYSSFGFIWDGKERKKIKVTKDSKHKVIVELMVETDAKNTDNS